MQVYQKWDLNKTEEKIKILILSSFALLQIRLLSHLNSLQVLLAWLLTKSEVIASEKQSCCDLQKILQKFHV